MLNVGKIEEGFVLDHIEAGKSLTIYHLLQLDKLDCTVAIIKNARSNKKGKKDILKVECDINTLNIDVLGFIDHNITVNVIKDGKIVDAEFSSITWNGAWTRNIFAGFFPRMPQTAGDYTLTIYFNNQFTAEKAFTVNAAQ